MHLTKRTARLSRFAVLWFLALSACERDPVVSPVTPMTPAVSKVFQNAISEPVVAALDVSTASEGDVVYVAFAVGDLPDARTVRISNISAGIVGTATYEVVNGALDPVLVSATVGDTLELAMAKFDGKVELLRAAVPARRAPRVIRTNPPKGRTDIGLNARVLVVFSEPIQQSSINASTFKLTLEGQAVQGSFVFDGPPTLMAEFVPAQPLASARSYTAVITTGIRDLSGDALEDSVAIDFSTIAPPGAAKIAFVSERDGNSEIYVANEDGSGQIRITANSASDLSPAWSPDGSRLAFASDRSGRWEIYIINADGSNLVQRTAAAFQFARAPAWSPDGRKIAFGGSYNSALWINIISAEDDGYAPVRLGNGYGYNSDPAWSPDGSEIAFVSDKNAPDEGVFDVYVTRADGSGIRPISSGRASGTPVQFSLHPDYSSDGRMALLYYWANLGTTTQPPFIDNVELAVTNADGTGLTIIASAGTTSRYGAGMPPSLTWSPDGSSIAFTSGICTGSLGQSCSYSIAVVKADGKDKRVIISDGHSPTWRR